MQFQWEETKRFIATVFSLMVVRNVLLLETEALPTAIDQRYRRRTGETVENVIFEMPDFEVEHTDQGVTALLQAYKVRQNPSDDHHDRLQQWVSVGYPQLTRNHRCQSIRLDPEGVSFYVKLLDAQQKQALLAKAVVKYDLSPSISVDDVIRPLPLSQFSCLLRFFQDGQEYTTRASLTDFNKIPSKLSFPMSKGSKRRLAFEKRLSEDGELNLNCELSSSGKQERVASLIITGDQLLDANLSAKLFGNQQETFLTRKQVMQLSGEIMSSLRIEEHYDSDAQEFGESYLQELLKQTHNVFQQVSFDQALLSLSGYGLPFGRQTLDPLLIRSELEHEFRVIDDVDQNQLLTVGHNPTSDIVAGVVMDTFDSLNDRYFVQSHRSRWLAKNLSIEQQLNELNTRPGSSIVWERVGNSIRPKEAKLLRLNRNVFGRSIKIERIKRRPANVLLYKTFSLEYSDAIPIDKECTGPGFSTGSKQTTTTTTTVDTRTMSLDTLTKVGNACRDVTGSGYRDDFDQSLFLTIDVLKRLDEYWWHCDGQLRRNISLDNTSDLLSLVAHHDCRPTTTTTSNPRKQTINLGTGASYSAVTSSSLGMLSVLCADDEHMNGFRFGVEQIEGGGLVTRAFARCCKFA